VVGLLRSFPVEEVLDMVEDDGLIHVSCEYCSRSYAVTPAEVTADEGPAS
jgi:molecular chaperone Hsp33